MNKQFQLGSFGAISIAEAAGVFTVQVSIKKAAGGGALAGFLSVEESLKLIGNGAQVVDAALLLAEQRWPALAPEIAPAKALIDAFLVTL